MTEYGSRHYLMYSTLVVLYLLAVVYGAESTETEDDLYRIYEDDRISIKNGEYVIPVRPTMSAALRAALFMTPRPDLDEIIRKAEERWKMFDRLNLTMPTITTLVDNDDSTDYDYEYEYQPHHGPGLLGVIVIVWLIIKRCCCGNNSETREGEETADDKSKLVV